MAHRRADVDTALATRRPGAGGACAPSMGRQPRFGIHGRATRTGVATPRARGQSLVEFSLVLAPFMLILLAVIQFGFVFNAYVTLTNTAREGGREGTIYLYSNAAGCTKTQNDLARNEVIRSTILSSLNMLKASAPQFTTTAPSGSASSCTLSGGWTSTTSGTTTTYTDGDLAITYTVPSGVTDTDPRVGEQVTVAATYHLDLIIPLIANLLPRDAGNRLALTGQVTMVVN